VVGALGFKTVFLMEEGQEIRRKKEEMQEKKKKEKKGGNLMQAWLCMETLNHFEDPQPN